MFLCNFILITFTSWVLYVCSNILYACCLHYTWNCEYNKRLTIKGQHALFYQTFTICGPRSWRIKYLRFWLFSPPPFLNNKSEGGPIPRKLKLGFRLQTEVKNINISLFNNYGTQVTVKACGLLVTIHVISSGIP